MTGDAGLTLHDSLQRVVTRFHNPLTERLTRTLREAELGRVAGARLDDPGMAVLVFPTLWMILLGPAIVALLVSGL